MIENDDYAQCLTSLPVSEWPEYLSQHCGLPGPRANLRLMSTVMTLAPFDMAMEWSSGQDEYLALCGAATLAAQATTPEIQRRLVPLALDDRWRVREGIVHGLQALFDHDPQTASELVQKWASSSEGLLIRAAIAAICEPRLLKDEDRQHLALRSCQQASDFLADSSPTIRRNTEYRKLRQALGYCWSVAVSANPDQGLPMFSALDSEDPDIAWVIRENLKKKRLARLVETDVLVSAPVAKARRV